MFSLKNEKKITKIILLITCAAFFLVCLYSILRYGNSTLLGKLSKPNNDDVKFIRSAWILAETGNYVYHNPPNPTVFMMPGLPFSVAFFVLIFGKFGALTAFRIFQAVLQTLGLLLIFFIGRRIFNSKVGVAAAILDAFCIAEIWTANLFLTETCFKFFVLLLIYFTIYAIKEKKTRYYVLGGIAWGLATLFRPTIATFPIIILIMWIKEKYTIKEMVKYTVIVSAIFCLILSPWWIRNYRIFHRFIPLTLATGNPMMQGTFIDYDQTTKATDGLDYSQFVYPADNDEIKKNELEMNMSKYRLKNLVPKQPLQFLYWYTIGKTIKTLNVPFYWEPILGISLFAAKIYQYILYALCLAGFVLFFRDKERNKMGNILFGTIIYFIVVYLPFFSMSRYFYPSMPYVIVFAAVPVVMLYDKMKERDVFNKILKTFKIVKLKLTKA